MFSPAAEPKPNRRFRFAEAFVVAAILLFVGFVLVTDGRQSPDTLVAGFNEALGR